MDLLKEWNDTGELLPIGERTRIEEEELEMYKELLYKETAVAEGVVEEPAPDSAAAPLHPMEPCKVDFGLVVQRAVNYAKVKHEMAEDFTRKHRELRQTRMDTPLRSMKSLLMDGAARSDFNSASGRAVGKSHGASIVGIGS